MNIENIDKIMSMTDEQIMSYSQKMFENREELYDFLSTVWTAIISYQQSIIEMQQLRSKKEYDREEFVYLDRIRTDRHNTIIGYLNALNRLCKWATGNPNSCIFEEKEIANRHGYALTAFSFLQYCLSKM